MILPKVCFGTFGIEKSPSILVNVLEEGIRFFDTAENYDDGQVERFLGIAVKNIRDNVIIATKISPENLLTKESIAESIEGSLKRLGTDYIDIYQIHWPHPMSNIEVIVESFQNALKAGKIRSIGVCNHSLSQSMCLDKYLGDDFISIQNEFNLIDNISRGQIIEHKYFLAYSILKHKVISSNIHNFVRSLRKKYGFTYSQVILSWIASFNKCVPIFTSLNKEHIKENLSIFNASTSKLEDSDITTLNLISATKEQWLDTSLIRPLISNQTFCPSPEELVVSISKGERLKPIKVLKNDDNTYTVVEGKVRYLAYKKSGIVPAIILGE